MTDDTTTIGPFDIPTDQYKKFKKKVIDEETTMTAKVQEWVKGYVGGEG